jgi:hypothetical protein
VKEIAEGAAIEFASGATSAALDDPRTGLGQIAEEGAMEAVGSGGITIPAAVAGEVANKFQKKDAPLEESPPEGIPAETPDAAVPQAFEDAAPEPADEVNLPDAPGQPYIPPPDALPEVKEAAEAAERINENPDAGTTAAALEQIIADSSPAPPSPPGDSASVRAPQTEEQQAALPPSTVADTETGGEPISAAGTGIQGEPESAESLHATSPAENTAETAPASQEATESGAEEGVVAQGTPPDLAANPAGGGQGVPSRVRVAGEEYEVVARNPDGTLKLKSEGGEFDTAPGEQWSEVGAYQPPSRKVDTSKTTRRQFQEETVSAKKFTLGKALMDAEAEIRKWKPKKPLPVGISKVHALASKERPSKEEKALLMAYNRAKANALGAADPKQIAVLEEHAGKVWDELHARQSATQPAQATTQQPAAQEAAEAQAQQDAPALTDREQKLTNGYLKALLDCLTGKSKTA